MAGRLVRLFDVDGPSPWQYYFICTPQMLETARVKAFRDWVFGEVGRFKLLFDQACEAGPAARETGNNSASAEGAANATSTGGTANANALRVAP